MNDWSSATLSRKSDMPDNLLIFDCDGVLVDSVPISLGLMIERCKAHGVVLDLAMACECCLGKPVAVAAREVNRIHQTSVPDIDLEDFQRKVLRQFELSLKPVPGIAQALEKLKQPKCVASSSAMKRIEKSVEITGLSDFFRENIFSTDMVRCGKPHPDIFLHAAREMGFTPSTALVIEDSPAGLQAAQAANMKTIAYTGGSHAPYADLKTKLAAMSPDILIEHMVDLPAAVDKLTAT